MNKIKLRKLVEVVTTLPKTSRNHLLLLLRKDYQSKSTKNLMKDLLSHMALNHRKKTYFYSLCFYMFL